MLYNKKEKKINKQGSQSSEASTNCNQDCRFRAHLLQSLKRSSELQRLVNNGEKVMKKKNNLVQNVQGKQHLSKLFINISAPKTSVVHLGQVKFFTSWTILRYFISLLQFALVERLYESPGNSEMRIMTQVELFQLQYQYCKYLQILP